MSISDLLVPEICKDGPKHFQTLVDTDQSYGETAFRRANGSIGYWNVSATRLGPDRYLGFVEDITDRKKNEEALQKSETRYRVLFEAISDAVYVHDVYGKLIDVNTEAYERLGYTRDEILKLFAFDIDINYPTADEVKTKIESAITSGPLRVESRHRSKNGLIFNVELNMNVFHEKGKDIFVTVARDITERLLAEKEKEKLIANLNQALTEVKKLSGLLPICCHCKKIRDDKGYWNQIEEYIHKHSEARFSHGICQECAKKLYPDFDLYDD